MANLQVGINAGLSKLGMKYVWGGDSDAEGGYDCSGLVSFILQQAGIIGPGERLTAAGFQAKYNAQPGDPAGKNPPAGTLLFNGSPAVHVGISLGNGKVLESTGDHVQINDIKPGRWTHTANPGVDGTFQPDLATIQDLQNKVGSSVGSGGGGGGSVGNASGGSADYGLGGIDWNRLFKPVYAQQPTNLFTDQYASKVKVDYNIPWEKLRQVLENRGMLASFLAANPSVSEGKEIKANTELTLPVGMSTTEFEGAVQPMELGSAVDAPAAAPSDSAPTLTYGGAALSAGIPIAG